MPTSYRMFLVEDDETLKSLPARVANRLYDEAHFPEYAGMRIRYLEAAIENEGGKPVRLIAHAAGYLYIDETGRPDRDKVQDAVSLAMKVDDASRGSDQPKNVIGITGRLSAKKLESEHRWKPTDRHITDLTAAIFPDQARQYGKPKVAKAAIASKPAPRITRDAERAARELRSLQVQLSMKLDMLSREDLKGLKHLAETDELDVTFYDSSDVPFYWQSVAAMIDHRQKVAKAENSKSGVWYAVAERFDQEGHRTSGSISHVEHVKCNGRDKAVRSAQELIRKYAGKFDVGVHYEVHVYPEIVWSPELAGVG